MGVMLRECVRSVGYKGMMSHSICGRMCVCGRVSV